MTPLMAPSTVPGRSGPGVHLLCLNCQHGRFFHELEIEGELTYTCPQCGHQLTGDEVRGYLHPAVLRSPALVLAAAAGTPPTSREGAADGDIRGQVIGQSRSADGYWRVVAMLENPGSALAHENATYAVDLVDAGGSPLASEAGLCGLLLPGQRVPVVVERRAQGPFRPTLEVYSGGTVPSGAVPLPATRVLAADPHGVRVAVRSPYAIPLSDLKVTVLQEFDNGGLRVASRGGVDLDAAAEVEVAIPFEGSDRVTSSEAYVTFTPLTLRQLASG